MKLKEFFESYLAQVEDIYHKAEVEQGMMKISDWYPGGVTVNEKGQVEYSPVSSSNTRTTSFTRFLNYATRKFNEQATNEWYFSGRDVQQVQDALIHWVLEKSGLANTRYTFELVDGEALWHTYRDGPQSCMKGKKSQSMLYWSNPDKVKILRIYDQGKFTGRALVWLTDQGETVMDRVYPGNGTLAYAARAYAKSQGWNYKTFDSVGEDFAEKKPYTVTLKHVTNRRLPYLDSFSRLVESTPTHLVLTNVDKLDYKCIGQVWGIGVGDFERTSSVYESGTFLDGQSIPRVAEYTERIYFGGGTYFRPVLISQPEMKDVILDTSVNKYLRPGDVVLRVGMRTLVRRKFVVIDGVPYWRSDVRKVRNQDTFVPKPNAQPIPIRGSHTYGNGATIYYM